MTSPTPSPISDQAAGERPDDDAIARSKRILALVDIYQERPDRMNRNALRGALLDEFNSALSTAPTTGSAPTDAARDILAERQRQVTAEGWTPEHDDEHGNQELAAAAACYALCAYRPEEAWVRDPARRVPPKYWPWVTRWWKPRSPRRDLVKAGALILAEIERLDRAALLAASMGGDRK